MKTHLVWFIVTVVVASTTGYASYRFTSEGMLAAHMVLDVSHAKMCDHLLNSLKRGDIEAAKRGIELTRSLSVDRIKSNIPFLENGYFQFVTQSFTDTGKKYLSSPNSVVEPTP